MGECVQEYDCASVKAAINNKDKIGWGATSDVYKAKLVEGGPFVAIKRLKKDLYLEKMLKNEL